MGERGRRFASAVAGLILALGASVCLAGVHDGGVGACSICHVMHDDTTPAGGDNPLLVAGNASDTCLACHADANGSVLGMHPLAPPPEYGAGKFIFLLEDNLNDAPGGMTNPIPGDAAGHNIQAPGHGLVSDGTYVNSPGGTYPAGDMGCTSCHDPHGNSNYRFLYGAGQVQANGYVFTNPAPEALGLDLAVGAPESQSNHVAYLSGMGAWCGNCHSLYVTSRHGGAASAFSHSGEAAFRTGMATQYNRYNGTLDPIGGTSATAYLVEVPFEDSGSTTGSTFGPSMTSRIMCLSCHRAHGSSAPRSGRWDFNVDTLGQDGVVSGSYPLPNPYGDPGQESLCFKCHRNIPGGGGTILVPTN